PHCAQAAPSTIAAIRMTRRGVMRPRSASASALACYGVASLPQPQPPNMQKRSEAERNGVLLRGRGLLRALLLSRLLAGLFLALLRSLGRGGRFPRAWRGSRRRRLGQRERAAQHDGADRNSGSF